MKNYLFIESIIIKAFRIKLKAKAIIIFLFLIKTRDSFIIKLTFSHYFENLNNLHSHFCKLFLNFDFTTLCC